MALYAGKVNVYSSIALYSVCKRVLRKCLCISRKIQQLVIAESNGVNARNHICTVRYGTGFIKNNRRQAGSGVDAFRVGEKDSALESLAFSEIIDQNGERDGRYRTRSDKNRQASVHPLGG